MNQFRNVSVTKREKLKERLFNNVLLARCEDIYIVKGKTRNGHGSICNHLVIVDCDKKQQFHENSRTSSMDVADYGIILKSEQAIPQSFENWAKQFSSDFREKTVMVKLQKEGYEQIYYLVSDVVRENYFITASSEDEIRRMGRILYCSRDDDPVESILEIIVRVYFGLAEYISPSDNELLGSVRKGYLQRVRTYLESGGDVNFADEYGRSLLHLAAHSGNVELVRFLIHKGANVHMEDKICGQKPVHIAAKEGRSCVVSFFHDVMASSINECDKFNWTPLHYAVWKGDLNTVKCLVEHGANINAEEIYANKKPIHIAAEHAYDDVMKYLFENGANIEDCDTFGRTPLNYSVLLGHLETSKILIGKGADINTITKSKKTLLHAAVFGYTKEIIEFLVKAGLDINKKDLYGRTPLHLAAFCYNYKFDILQVLADLGADFFALDKNGKNPLVLSEKKHAFATLHIVYWMCKKLQEQGKYTEAVELYDENREIIKKLIPDHPEYFELLEIQNKIGVMLYEMSQYDKAETNFKDVLRNRERFLGANHISTLSTKHWLALVYSAQIRYSEAMDILKEVLESQKTILGANHDATLNVSRDLANVHKNKGEYDEALEMFTHVFEKRNEYYGSDHLKTLQARQDMAVIFVNKGDLERALRIFKDVRQKRILLLGKNHPETLQAYYHVKVTSRKIKETTLPQGESCSIF